MEKLSARLILGGVALPAFAENAGRRSFEAARLSSRAGKSSKTM
jgi:hypothetical protein